MQGDAYLFQLFHVVHADRLFTKPLAVASALTSYVFTDRCQHELKSGSAKCSHARSKQGKGEKDFTPKRRGRQARTSR